MTKNIVQQRIEIAQKIDSIVNYNIPPENDAGTIQNLSNLIDDLTEYLNDLTNVESSIGQQTLSL